MTRYRLAFDGQFREGFGDLREAVERASDVAASGRFVWVARGYLRPKLLAVFPEDHAVEGERRWRERDGGPRRGPWPYVKEVLLEVVGLSRRLDANIEYERLPVPERKPKD